MEVFVARQPIFDRGNKVFGYELLYRKSQVNTYSNDIAGNVATSILLMNSYYSFGINRLSEGKIVFINFEKKLVMKDIPRILDKDMVIVEAPIPLSLDLQYMRCLGALKNDGYRIAIEANSKGIHDQYIDDYCAIVEVDILSTEKDQVLQVVKKWQDKGKSLLAKKIESYEAFEWAKSVGFEFFQGFYFSKPEVIKTKGLLSSKTNYIRVLKELSEDEPDYDDISEIIESDPVITYRLLKLVNANISSYNKVSTVKQALVAIGLNDFEKWISLTLIADLAENKPPELLKLAMLRGKFLELMFGSCLGEHKASEGMLIGLMSVVDALTDQHMVNVLNSLPLSVEIKETLLHEETPYKIYFEVVLSIEKGNYGIAFAALDKAKVYIKDLMAYYYQSIDWAAAMYALIKSEE